MAFCAACNRKIPTLFVRATKSLMQMEMLQCASFLMAPILLLEWHLDSSLPRILRRSSSLEVTRVRPASLHVLPYVLYSATPQCGYRMWQRCLDQDSYNICSYSRLVALPSHSLRFAPSNLIGLERSMLETCSCIGYNRFRRTRWS